MAVKTAPAVKGFSYPVGKRDKAGLIPTNPPVKQFDG
jgi:hypothetical protein